MYENVWDEILFTYRLRLANLLFYIHKFEKEFEEKIKTKKRKLVYCYFLRINIFSYLQSYRIK